MCKRSAQSVTEGIALGSHHLLLMATNHTNSHRTQFETKDTRGAQASPKQVFSQPNTKEHTQGVLS